MRVITGCLRSTPVSNIQVLAGIAPPDIRRRAKTAQLITKAKKDGSHVLHETVTKNRRSQRLKSRKPLHRQKVGNIEGKTPAENWMKEEWQSRWQDSTSRLKGFITEVQLDCNTRDLSRKAWVRLNRLRTGVGRFKHTLWKWKLTDNPLCGCGEAEQTPDHVLQCRQLAPPNGREGLLQLDEETREWLKMVDLDV